MSWEDILQKEEINKFFKKPPSPREFLGEKEYNKTKGQQHAANRKEIRQQEKGNKIKTEAQQKKRSTGYSTFEEYLATPFMVELTTLLNKYKSKLSILNLDIESLFLYDLRRYWNNEYNLHGLMNQIITGHIGEMQNMPDQPEDVQKILGAYYREFLAWAEKHFPWQN